MRQVYLNNAATSYPKPAAVVEAVARSLAAPPREPGRAGGEEEDPLWTCRRELAALFNVGDPCRIAILPSATHAINGVIDGLLQPGDEVVTTVLEHNSVLRPLAHRGRDRGVGTRYVEPDEEGRLSRVLTAVALRDTTRLIAITHASNVTGSIQPVEEIAGLAAEAGIPFLIDAAQSAGAIPLDVDALPGRVFVAFAGHKGLLGPAGVGGLIVPDDELPQTIVGGTGVRSESLLHPPDLPLRHEAGTPNLPGIAGLAAGVRGVRARGITAEGQHRHALVSALREQLGAHPGIALSPLAQGDGRAGIVSFTCADWSPEELGFVLRESFGIITRTGLHCAPLIHGILGTAPLGTVRVSVGRFNHRDEVDYLVDSLSRVLGR